MSPRSRDKIIGNLETVYRDAYQRAKEVGDQGRMLDLDASFQREQLLLEVLIDIRDALAGLGGGTPGQKGALDKLQQIKDLTKLR